MYPTVCEHVHGLQVLLRRQYRFWCALSDDEAVNVQRENIHFKDGFVALKSDKSRNKFELEDICGCECVCVHTLKGSCFKRSADAPVSVH